MSSFCAIALTLFFVIDALGNIPAYLYLLKPYAKKKRILISVRELFFALLIMVAFHYVGELLLGFLGISAFTVQIAGGVVLFLIAIRLIFSNEEERVKWKEQEPFIVPIATPMIASPSLLAIIMIFAQEHRSSFVVLGAISAAWLASSIIFLCAQPIYNLVKSKGLDACQRLMGLIVALIAVQLFLEGVAGAVK